MNKRKKIVLSILAAILIPIVGYVALFFIRFPIRDPVVLKALNAEARILIAKKFVTTKKPSENADWEIGPGDNHNPQE